jgi:type VI protein secretion system component VasK
VAVMLVFVLFQSAPPIMLLVLAVTLYLVVMDLRQEDDLDFTYKVRWFLFVLLTHVPGYLIFRVWIAVRRHRRQDEAHTTSPGPRGRRGDGQA